MRVLIQTGREGRGGGILNFINRTLIVQRICQKDNIFISNLIIKEVYCFIILIINFSLESVVWIFIH